MKRKNLRSPIKTKYPGVYYRLGVDSRGNAEKNIYISYRREGRQIFEPVGVEGYMIGDPPVKLTLSVANDIRSARRRGIEPSNQERREAAAAEKAAEDSRWTIGKLAKEYFEHRERQKTIKVDECLYKRYLEDEFKDKTPEEIDPLSLDRFRKKLSLRKSLKNAEKTISPVTVRNGMALLRQIANHGVERHLTKGFSSKIPVPRVTSRGKEEDLSPAQLYSLLTAIATETDQDAADVVRLALYTGARREEILRVKWEDVDLDRGLWMLRNRKDGGDRGFPLSPEALAVLVKRDKAKVKGVEHVFPGGGENGYLRDPRAAFDRIKAAAKLPEGFRLLHGCRHHYATMLVAAGVDMLSVARLLGHADAQMVMRRYAHVRPGVLAQAAQLSGKLIAEAVAKAKGKAEEGAS